MEEDEKDKAKRWVLQVLWDCPMSLLPKLNAAAVFNDFHIDAHLLT